ncbi:hypothetical protein MPTK1_5g06680 [Marchantia polymorpha subsp. ruderalis]|uniref:Uncharacterized protein n=2 Tax=Marchantia polymorpha TaxID=3197 RepID=A0AAF6BFN5_MARPO|nr:hypothetical protein MARPO_0171s0015 [Marchantia polymorpha]BBN10819.1 hypothetical protein Mp_5g06680 [Marchantia polymorpha subsp. ruderalis]|eukprot:PTQ28173.1 hypothetical protein MARPO_0171s0015 [Marchantia polymorpha]
MKNILPHEVHQEPRDKSDHNDPVSKPPENDGLNCTMSVKKIGGVKENDSAQEGRNRIFLREDAKREERIVRILSAPGETSDCWATEATVLANHQEDSSARGHDGPDWVGL